MMNSHGSEQQPESLSIAFVDATLGQTDVFLKGFQADQIKMLDPQGNGIEQISEVLEQYDHTLESVHIFSQGGNAVVQLGGTLLDANSLSMYENQVAAWGDALTQGGDLLFYSSRLARNNDGKDLVEQIGQLTQADIAASDDLTGGRSWRGDWDLEVTTGNIDWTFSPRDYQGLLGGIDQTFTPTYQPPEPEVLPADPQGMISNSHGNGLKAEYYNTIDFTDLALTRTDATVDFDWIWGAPDQSMQADTFSVRWSGQIEPQFSETYTFQTTGDDGVRLWVNNQLIIDRFYDQAATSHRGSITLEAGEKYDIRMDYYENRGRAVAELAWSSQSQPLEIVPQSQLFSGSGDLSRQPGPGIVPEDPLIKTPEPSDPAPTPTEPVEPERPIQTDNTILDIQFESHQPGRYTEELVDQDWENVDWANLGNRANIVEDPDAERGQVLKVTYPKGSVGSKRGGSQFEVAIPEAEELWLSYHVKFGEGFDFRRGGKLPGLASGGADYTGGNRPTEGQGWSARYMWKENGAAIAYPYYVDMPGKWGEFIPLEDFTFEPGQWHQITQHVKLNTDSQANGVLETWIDGKQVQSRSDMRLRLGDNGKIDSFYFSTFHGGKGSDWAPTRDSHAYFDNFIISEEAPASLT